MGLLPPMVLGLGATPAERDVTVVTVVLQRRCLPLGSRIPPARSSPTSISLSRFTNSGEIQIKGVVVGGQKCELVVGPEVTSCSLCNTTSNSTFEKR